MSRNQLKLQQTFPLSSINDPDFSKGQIRCAKGDDQPSMHKYNVGKNQIPKNK